MNSNTKKQSEPNNNVRLSPNPRLPLLIILIGAIFLLPAINAWPGILIISFGVFLLLQSFTLRIEFSPDELIVLQLGRVLRRFPYQNWLAWRILLPQVPGLFYFREEASPHLLPILFDPNQLEEQLKLRVGSLEISNKKDSQA